MVYISGPRQVGKTHLSQSLMNKDDIYLNWDDPDHRAVIRARDWFEDHSLIVLDEIHKFSKWRNWLKGTYDTQKEKHQFLVTGSALLNLYRRGGDSLFGRYHHWRLHPFCLSELKHDLKKKETKGDFEALLMRGGFPEPYFSGSAIEANRWRKERRDLILREDLRDLERVRDISQIDLLMELLTERVGGGVVIGNLARDLDVAPKTVKSWLSVFERLYLGFLVFPYSQKLPRAIKKTPKFYFLDTGQVPSKKEGLDSKTQMGAKFENLVACHLLKRMHFLEDSLGERFSLFYLRDKEGREVDFLIVKNRKPHCLIEVKWREEQLASGLNYFGERLGISNRIQLVGEARKSKRKSGVQILPAIQWLSRPLGEEFVGN